MKTLVLLALAGTALAAERFPNFAADSPLPHGDGFAAKFHGDVGAATHPAVIFADNFEEGELGARWDDKGAGKGKALSFAPSSCSSTTPRASLTASRRSGSTGACSATGAASTGAKPRA